MDFLTALHISTTGLTTQRTRMNVISTNLANVNTTRTQSGDPYRRKVVLMEAKPVEDFESALRLSLKPEEEELHGVGVREIAADRTPFRRVYSPGHPDADQMGYVSYPNVNVITEMADMMISKRSYEANVTAISATKGMALKALEIGR
ncbi:MAG: flagellar basal body rod protein FlgC [Desulfobacterales bacterium]|nr:flagellar basal body rod protein FlgC [Desulfobacterales bacterium]